MASIHSIAVSGLGKQNNSMKPTSASCSFGTASRDQQTKIFLTKELERKCTVSDCSPGPVYCPNFLTTRRPPKYGFGTSPRLLEESKEYGGNIYGSISAAENGTTFQDSKFKKPSSVVFGYDIRCQNKNSAVTAYHPQAGKGVISPGPSAYSPDESATKKSVHRYSFASRPTNGIQISSTPRAVGPGSYPVENALGHQNLSVKKTSASWSFAQTQRLQSTPRDNTIDRTSDLSSLGKQILSTGVSSAAYGFGTASREQYVGQIKSAAKPRKLYHPKLDLETVRLKYS